MISSLEKINPAFADPINQPMFLGHSARPAACQDVLERFRLPNPCEWISQHRFYEFEDPQCYFTVCARPVSQILAELGVEYRFAFTGPGQVPSPAAAFRWTPACLFAPQRVAAQLASAEYSWAIAEDGQFPSNP
jgi:hypothetical protein